MKSRLEQGFEALGLVVEEAQLGRLLGYLDLIEKWNRVYNLTAIRDKEKMVAHHLLDSLSIVPYVNARRCADVGSGAGLPGIPLAIMKPDMAVVLIESNGKKAAFIRQTIIELGLDNASVEARRVETVEGKRFDAVVSRAFADTALFARLALPICASGGMLLAMKGQHRELSDLPEEIVEASMIPLHVPFLEGERHLVMMKTKSE